MLNKLTLRNAGRLWKDYLHYFLTLCMIAALTFSFHSLLFSKDIRTMIYYGDRGELSTAALYTACFVAAMFRNRRMFSHMEIIHLINMDKQNETVNERRNAVWERQIYL